MYPMHQPPLRSDFAIDVPMSAIKAQLSTFSGQRQNIIHVNDYILIDDAYNASPDSMKSKFKYFI